MKIDAFFDGACEPRNPGGNMGLGACIIDADTAEILFEYSHYVPAAPKNSNNVAEYMALVRVLEWFIENKYNEPEHVHITIHGDSMLAVEQMQGNWRMKGGRYMPHALRALELLQKFNRRPSFQWVSRWENTTADSLSKRAMIKNNVHFKIQPQ